MTTKLLLSAMIAAGLALAPAALAQDMKKTDTMAKPATDNMKKNGDMKKPMTDNMAKPMADPKPAMSDTMKK